ncbi:MAG: hypothetical protein KGR47_05245 [Acidobacteria bacterium]|nr:hypothetical protein [Acidobacteriota bacterium]
MRTRTLLLLAVTCGLAILVAGTVQLLRLTGQQSDTPLPIGRSGRAGDAAIVVTSYDETGSAAVVSVVLSGVDDSGGTDGFVLVTPGKPVPHRVWSSAAADECRGFTIAEVRCTLTFPLDGVNGQSRQLLFERGGERVRWKLR